MPRRSRVDWYAVDAAAPNRVLSLQDLATLGVPRRTIAERCRPGGPWSRPLPGVVLLQNGTPSQAQRIDAALRYGGPGALLTGIVAARLYGVTALPPDPDLHLLVPAHRRRGSRPGVIVERTTRIPDSRDRRGFALAPPVRSVLDGARRLPGRDQITALLADAVQRGLGTAREMLWELRAGSDRGSALPRAVLLDVLAGIRSPAEGWGRRLLEGSRLPEPMWNVPVHDPDGRFLTRPDAWFDEVALAWEIDSFAFHLSPEDYARTLQRHALMTAAGVLVVHTLPNRLRSEPREVLAELEAAYQVAAARPRPSVYVPLAA